MVASYCSCQQQPAASNGRCDIARLWARTAHAVSCLSTGLSKAGAAGCLLLTLVTVTHETSHKHAHFFRHAALCQQSPP